MSNKSTTIASEKRFLKVLKGEPVDRPPFWFMRQAGRYLPEYRATRADAGDFLSLCYNSELAEEVTLQPIRRYGMDAAILFADILLLPQALGQHVAFKAGEGPVLDALSGSSAVARLQREGIHDTLAPIYDTVSRLSRSLPDDVALIGFAGAPWTVATYMVEGGGSKDYATTKAWAFSDADDFQALIDLITESTADYLIEQIKAGAEAIQIFDTWAGALPAVQMRRWCLEPLKRIRERIAEAYPDVPVIGFPRGIGTELVTAAKTTGVDALSIDWAMDVEWVRDNVQPLVTVQGNLDPRAVVVGGRHMREGAAHVLDTLAPAGNFIFNLGHGFVPETPPEHVAELCQMIKGWKKP